jgi:hypothetical protein
VADTAQAARNGVCICGVRVRICGVRACICGIRVCICGIRVHICGIGMHLRDKAMHPYLVGRQRGSIRMRMRRCCSQASRRQPSFESRAPSLHVRSPAHRRIDPTPTTRVREYSVQLEYLSAVVLRIGGEY